MTEESKRSTEPDREAGEPPEDDDGWEDHTKVGTRGAPQPEPGRKDD